MDFELGVYPHVQRPLAHPVLIGDGQVVIVHPCKNFALIFQLSRIEGLPLILLRHRGIVVLSLNWGHIRPCVDAFVAHIRQLLVLDAQLLHVVAGHNSSVLDGKQ